MLRDLLEMITEDLHELLISSKDVIGYREVRVNG